MKRILSYLKSLTIKHKNILLVMLGGIFFFLSFPNANLYFLAWISLTPLLLAAPADKIIKSFLYGFLYGFTANIGILYWIYPTVYQNTKSAYQSVFALVLLCSYMALYPGIWTLILHIIKPKTSVFRFTLFASSLWVALELIRTKIFWGFPWSILGYSQWKFLSIIQIAEFTGVFGVSFLIVWFNVGITRIIRTKRILSFIPVLSAMIAIIIIGYALLQKNQSSPPPYIKVAIIQPNIDQYKKWNTDYESEIRETFEELLYVTLKDNPDLIVWPETAIPDYLPTNAYYMSWINRVAQKTNAYHIIGAPYYNGGSDYYNASFLFGPEGQIMGWHLKNHLVPFGEFVPFRNIIEPYFSVFNNLGDFSRGTTPSIFSVKSILLAPTICSENLFGDLVRQFVLRGADIIINQTNDAWYFRTSAAKQHFTMNVFRAIENRRSVVVCGNTGVSGIIEPYGYISSESEIYTKTYFFARVAPRSDNTFYTKYGDIFAYICLITALMMFFSSKIRKIGFVDKFINNKIEKIFKILHVNKWRDVYAARLKKQD